MLLTVAAFGLAVGSFLNVVIARLPARRSLWRPGSACLVCGAAIAWHDNVPLLSFVVLRGRCRTCGAAISWRYPIVEATTAGLFLLAYAVFGLTLDFAVAVVLLSALVAITAIDLEHQIIPDAITLPGTLAGVAANLATGRVPIIDCMLGIVVGSGVFLAILLGYQLLMRHEGMGGGDVKLGAMLGAFLGWKIMVFTIFIAATSGGVLAIVLLAAGVAGRKQPIPFGPFLALGGAVGLLWGERLVTWYMSGFAR